MHKQPLIFSTMPRIMARSGNNVKDPLNITIEAAETVAKVKISGSISEWSETAADYLGKEIQKLVASGLKDCEVYINTRGGDTLRAKEIVNELRGFPGKITATGGAIVASAGTYITSLLDSFSVFPNTQFMYHRPKLSAYGNADEVESQVKAARDVDNEYAQVYAEKTGKTIDEIKSSWSKGDVWLMGKEIVDAGFADKLIEREVPITAEDIIVLEACAAPVIPKATETKHNNTKLTEMEKVKLIASLGLPADATDEQIDAAVTANKAAADRLARVEAENRTNAITALVDGAISSKKITAESRASWVALAEKDFDNAKATIESLHAPEKPAPQGGKGAPGGAGSGDDKSNWTYADYAEKDPEAYKQLMKDDPAKADAIFEAHLKSNQ